METIKGYIRYEPEMRFTPNGVALTTFSLTDTTTLEGRYNTIKKVITWELLAETCNRLLQIDNEVYAKGYWKTRSWQTPEGETKTVQEFTAKQVWLFENNQFHDIMEIEERNGKFA